MVNYEVRLDRVFGALGSPKRRAIMLHLEKGGVVSVSELAEPLAMKLPAILKQLDVLENACLITRAKEGRTMYVRIAPAPMAEAAEWLRRYERFWSRSLDRLVVYAEKKELQAKGSRS
jgi:DNA-binding transcriptional ArsR family regulator